MWRAAKALAPRGGAAGLARVGGAATGVPSSSALAVGATTSFRRDMAGFDRKKYKDKVASKQTTKKTSEGRDPYGLFKQAITSQSDPATWPSPDYETRKAASDVIRSRRANYSRQKFLLHHRQNGHFSKMIKLREAAIAALPEQLREEALVPDLEPFPIQRRVFTETAPIKDFQEKLIQRVPT